jgi:hypothetical protein
MLAMFDGYAHVMLSGELIDRTRTNFEMARSTVRLRAEQIRPNLFSVNGRGPRSGARMTNADAVNLMLAVVLEHGRGEDVAENVRRVRALPPEGVTSMPEHFARPLACVHEPTAGEALEMCWTISAPSDSACGPVRIAGCFAWPWKPAAAIPAYR